MTTTVAGPPGTAPTHHDPGRKESRPRRTWAPYLFVSPFYLLYVLFMLIPVGVSVWLSLTEWVGLGAPRLGG